jgi:D-glycero-D-manno-heptose 1,7-bisphosphate phosphatase
MQAPKLVILGRDGVLNSYRDDHVKDPSEFEPLPGALEAIARLNHVGWHVVVATNQAGVGRGMIDMASLNAVHSHMMKLVLAAGGRIDAVFICPHTPEDHCECRKPNPGMMKQIALRWGVNLAKVPMVGDSLRELTTAVNAGCLPHLVCTGRAAMVKPEEIAQWRDLVPSVQVHADLPAFAEALIEQDETAPHSVPGSLN